MKLGTGSIVELDRAINHPVDLLVNDRPIARGEIVAVEESFGLQITELLPLTALLDAPIDRHAGRCRSICSSAYTLLSLVPFLLVMCTSFVRIVVVLSLVRSAIGASALPPNAVFDRLCARADDGRHGADRAANRSRRRSSLFARRDLAVAGA